MKKIKIILLEFNATERKHFLKYLDLDYASTVYFQLFKFLLSKDTKSNQEIFEILYPSEIYTDGRMRLVFHRAKKILFEYLASRNKSKFEEKKQVYDFFKEKKLSEIQKTYFPNKVDSEIENHSYQFEFSFDRAIMVSEDITSRGIRSIEPKLMEAHSALDYFYFIEKLKLACNAANYSRLTNYTYNLQFFQPVLDFLEVEDIASQPLLYLYYHTYLMISTQEEEKFELILDYLSQIEIPENDDYREILISCLNFCIQKINKGQHQYAKKTLEVYQLQLKSRNIYVNGKLPSNTYKNVAILGLRLKEYEWTMSFIESEKSKLNSRFPLEDYQLVKSRYHFELEEYDTCIQLILQSRPTDVLDSLQFRILQSKTYFELDEWDMVDSTIQNALIFLLRHKSKAYQVLIYKNFFKCLQKIIRSKQTKKDLEILTKLVSETNPMAEKPWMLEKIKELK